MTEPAPLVDVWRGEIVESRHFGHAVIVGETGQIEAAWGDPDVLVYPRSSAKMLQALPLVTSGAAKAHGLTPGHIALACASHIASDIHTVPVRAWLDDLGLPHDALLCGPQTPEDEAVNAALIRAGESPCSYHNNCSGKHTGFLTLGKHLAAGPEYIAIDHPVQLAVREAWEEATGETSPGWSPDGCSAPNFFGTLAGLARAMARFATAATRSGRLAAAELAIQNAIMAHPELTQGEGRSGTELMRAAPRTVLKGGAEGVYVAILPELRKGVALKIADGTTRAAETAITALLVHLGALDPGHPTARRWLNTPVSNRNGWTTGHIRPAEAFPA